MMLQKYIWMLHNMHVASVCFKCFKRMLQVFYLDVAKLDLDVVCVCNGFQVFLGVLQVFSEVCCKCFNYFGRMVQVFQLDVAKVDLVLHVSHWDHMPQPPAAVVGALESV